MKFGSLLARGVAWTTLGQASQTLASMGSAALINRAVSPAGRGVIADVQSWVGLLIALFGLSLAVATYHFANRERYPFSDAARLYLVLVTSAGTALLATASMSALIWGWPEMLSIQAHPWWPYILALPAATIFATNVQTLGFALAQTKLAAAVTVLVAVGSVLVVVPAYLLEVIDVGFAIAMLVVMQVVTAAIMTVVIWQRVGCSRVGVDLALLSAFVGVGLKQHVATIATFAYTRVNQIIVFHYCGDSQTGLLATAHTLAFGVFAMVGAVQIGLYGAIARSAGDGYNVTLRVLRIGFYGGLLVVAPLVGFAGVALRIYGGGRFEDAALCFRLLVPAAWLLSLSSLTAPYYVKAGAFGAASVVSFVLGVVGVVANFILVPRFAANGAAAATLLTLAIGFVAVLGMLRWISGITPMAALVPDFGVEVNLVKSWLVNRRERIRLASSTGNSPGDL